MVVMPRTASSKSRCSSASRSWPRWGPVPRPGPGARAGAAGGGRTGRPDVAEVAHVLEPEAAAGRRPGPPAAEHAAHGPELADLVVLLALLLVAHHVVGGRHLLEALLGGLVARVGVGWYWRDSLRYALLMSLAEAVSLTPRTR